MCFPLLNTGIWGICLSIERAWKTTEGVQVDCHPVKDGRTKEETEKGVFYLSNLNAQYKAPLSFTFLFFLIYPRSHSSERFEYLFSVQLGLSFHLPIFHLLDNLLHIIQSAYNVLYISFCRLSILSIVPNNLLPFSLCILTSTLPTLVSVRLLPPCIHSLPILRLS